MTCADVFKKFNCGTILKLNVSKYHTVICIKTLKAGSSFFIRPLRTLDKPLRSLFEYMTNSWERPRSFIFSRQFWQSI